MKCKDMTNPSFHYKEKKRYVRFLPGKVKGDSKRTYPFSREKKFDFTEPQTYIWHEGHEYSYPSSYFEFVDQ